MDRYPLGVYQRGGCEVTKGDFDYLIEDEPDPERFTS